PDRQEYSARQLHAAEGAQQMARYQQEIFARMEPRNYPGAEAHPQAKRCQSTNYGVPQGNRTGAAIAERHDKARYQGLRRAEGVGRRQRQAEADTERHDCESAWPQEARTEHDRNRGSDERPDQGEKGHHARNVSPRMAGWRGAP